MNKLALGIDIGGTNIKLGLVSREGGLTEFDQTATPKSDPELSVAIIAGIAEEFLESAGENFDSIAGVGIGFPGSIDRLDGKVRAAPNLSGWGGIALGNLFAERIGQEVFIDNDANLAALAEFKWGAGKGLDPLVLFTLGTGVGGGIILNGEIFHGAWGGAAEIGHQTIDFNGRVCKCGNRGCIEAYVGTKGVAARTWELLREDKGSLLWELMGGEFDSLDARLVGVAAKDGDPTALIVAGEITRALGVAAANMINVLNPASVLLAGGMTEWGEELLLKPVIREARHRALKSHFRSCKIALATAGIKAGVLGAAALVFRQ